MKENNRQTIMQRMFNLFKNRIFLSIVLICLVFVSLFTGVHQSVTFKNIISFDQKAWLVLTTIRAPRTIAILLAASSLSVGGLIMQSISRNKFVAPSTVGATDAAQLGVLIGMFFFGGLNRIQQVGIAFVFAFVAVLIFMTILNKIQFKDAVYVPLIGMMYGSILSAITMFLAQHFNREELINGLNAGSFNLITNQNVWVLFIVLIPLILALFYATRFTIVSAGKDFAENLGVRYKQVILAGLMMVSLIAASTYIIVGPLPFIGIIIPNIVVSIYGDNVKRSIFDIMLFGSIFVLINDIIARLIIYPYEVQISLIMGVIGAAIFLTIIFRRAKHA